MKNVNHLDHRVFQYAHDVTASYFRYDYNKLEEENEKYLTLDLPPGFVGTGFRYEYEPLVAPIQT